jgi:hypothetical protein
VRLKPLLTCACSTVQAVRESPADFVTIVQGFFCKIIDQVRPLIEKERAILFLEYSNMFYRSTTPR